MRKSCGRKSSEVTTKDASGEIPSPIVCFRRNDGLHRSLIKIVYEPIKLNNLTKKEQEHMNRYLFCLLLLFAIGCGGHPSVGGKVTFPDGSPLTEGQVLFESASLVAQGTIQKDGTYTIRTGEEKGVPAGTYKVSIGGFKPTYESSPPPPSGCPPPPPRVTAPVIPIARKFLDSATSGLVCEVKNKTTFNIEVEPSQ